MTGLKLYYLLKGSVGIFKYMANHMKDLSQVEIVEIRRIDDAFFNYHKSIEESREVLQQSMMKAYSGQKSSLGSKMSSRRASGTRKRDGNEPGQKSFTAFSNNRLAVPTYNTGLPPPSQLYLLMVKHKYQPLAKGKIPEPEQVFNPSEFVQMSFEESNKMLSELTTFCNKEYELTKGFLEGANEKGLTFFEMARQRFFGRKLRDLGAGVILGERALDNEQQPRTATVGSNGTSEYTLRLSSGS